MNKKPFANESRTTSQLMLLVCVGLIPGATAQFYFFGWGVLINLMLCSFYAISTEALILKIRKRPILITLKDNSALLTGLLLGLALPPLIPWWMSLVGICFAITFAKHLYGGLGYNPFNPAMIGYVLLLVSFPLAMTNWLPTQELLNLKPNLLQSIELTFFGLTQINLNQTNLIQLEIANDISHVVIKVSDLKTLADGFTMATPLDHIRTSLSQGFMISEILSPSNENALLKINSNSWMWINIAYLIGGLFILFLKVIRWHIPLSILVSMATTALFLSIIDDQRYLAVTEHLFYGATMLGAFFIATDPVSAATTQKGRIFYGALIGFILIVIRTYGSYPDAVAFAVILINIAVPTIDHYFRPKVYGSSTTIKSAPIKSVSIKSIPIKQLDDEKE